MAKKKTSKKSAKKSAKKASKKMGRSMGSSMGGSKKTAKKGTKKTAKKGAKKAAKKKGRRTVMYSTGGKKLYAVRAADGSFKDIQQYSRAHAQDINRHSAAEIMAESGSTHGV